MDVTGLGVQSHLTRVEAWEFDYNGHWNTRFYVRSFQQASEAVVPVLPVAADGGSSPRQWQMRFHRELRSMCSVAVRSAQVRGGDHDGAVVHLLIGDGQLSATCLELGTRGSVRDLPVIDADMITCAYPRSITRPVTWSWPVGQSRHAALVGTIRPAETDHRGALLLEHLVRCWSQASHQFHDELGFTPEYAERSGTARALVEVRLTWFDNCRAGDQVEVSTRLGAVSGKTFEIIHLVQTDQGDQTAVVEQTSLAIDVRERRAIEVPEFLR